MKTNEMWTSILRNLQNTNKEKPLKTDILIKKENKTYYITEVWKEDDNVFYKVENLDTIFNLSRESFNIKKQVYKEIIDIIYHYKILLPYLKHREKCYCRSVSWNDAQTPDFWNFKGYDIYINQEGLFDITKESDTNCISNTIKTCSSLKEAIEFIKNNKKLKQC